MLRLAIAFCLLACASHARAELGDRPPPEAYLDPVDQRIARTGQGEAGRPWPCTRQILDADGAIVTSLPTDQCVKMTPVQRWRGFWRNDFEGSQFCEQPARECSFQTPGGRVWLNFGDYRDASGLAPGGLYQVEFAGRRTIYEGGYGHLGVFDHEIIVDKLISLSEMEPPPPVPTEAELEASFRACRAEGNCFSAEDLRSMRKEEHP